MGAEAEKYLKDHLIPQLFEGLMTGLIYNKPDRPVDFLENALAKIKNNPHMTVRWDTFVDSANLPAKTAPTEASMNEKEKKPKKKKEVEATLDDSAGDEEGEKPRKKSVTSKKSATRSGTQEMGHQRRPSVAKAAQHAYVNPTAPIILFMGGPGGGKTKYAAKVRDSLENKGLVHICVPDLIKEAIKRYKTVYPEWKEASRKYDRGELISNDLIQMLVKAEMGRFPNANAYFLEGFPREAKQVEDFEKNIRSVNLAMILDYDEETLRTHMMNRGLDRDVIDRRINEFRNKTLPSAKYFDDHRLLYLIPGEKDDSIILERMKKLVKRAMESGVSALTKHSAAATKGKADSTMSSREPSPSPSRPSTKDKINSRTNAEEKPNSIDASGLSNSKVSDNELKLRIGREKDSARPTTTETTTPSKPQTPALAEARSYNSLSRGTVNGSFHTSASTADIIDYNALENKNSSSEQTNRSDNQEVTKTSATQNQSRPSTNKSRNSRPGTGTEIMRQGPASKPPTPNGSRPATTSSKKSIDLNSRPTSVPKTPTKDDNTTSRSLAAEGELKVLPEENIVDPAAEASARLMSASTVSRIPTAADRFPKGLPNNAPVILILGAPGSNKREMAEKVAKKYEGFVHISMGDLLRKKVNENPEDELWIRVGKKIEAGEQIPMKICREILYSTVHDMGNRSWGYVIEGYPRTLAQAEDIESQLGRLDLALLLDCTEQFCKDNIIKRFEDAKENGNGRPDDDEQPLKQKLALFKQNTLPMLKHLDEKKKLRVIEGDGPVDRLFSTVTELLDNTVFANENKSVPEIQNEGRDLRTTGSVES